MERQPHSSVPLNEELLAQERLLKRERRTRKAYERARQTRAGLFIYLMMSGIALKMAANSEPNPKIRQARRAFLTDRWRRFSGDLMRSPYPHPVD
ncbi:MAG TPA: hypothetical protein VJ836_04870 [Candidatus Saccharimonadales bacterium]|nr:hypothetical protein [Candidatus Saccharimonadales bacterium]